MTPWPGCLADSDRPGQGEGGLEGVLKIKIMDVLFESPLIYNFLWPNKKGPMLTLRNNPVCTQTGRYRK